MTHSNNHYRLKHGAKTENKIELPILKTSLTPFFIISFGLVLKIIINKELFQSLGKEIRKISGIYLIYTMQCINMQMYYYKLKCQSFYKLYRSNKKKMKGKINFIRDKPIKRNFIIKMQLWLCLYFAYHLFLLAVYYLAFKSRQINFKHESRIYSFDKLSTKLTTNRLPVYIYFNHSIPNYLLIHNQLVMIYCITPVYDSLVLFLTNYRRLFFTTKNSYYHCYGTKFKMQIGSSMLNNFESNKTSKIWTPSVIQN